MNATARLAREDAITEALRVVNDAIGDEVPSAQAFRIIDAIKRLRDGQPVRVTSGERRDYLSEGQEAARVAWNKTHSQDATGPEYDALIGIDTPLGRLRVTTWRRPWSGERGERIAWASEYYLNDLPITVAEIRACGLAQRPTSRNRKRS
ncbi:hypothetical protein RFM23_05335 [Mesorhizobium abyssinicae]|uniref:HK97 gp10 family phage protein n=1 Tax=Mesorhizobium abyssinicae TaxID=1209958 RepID=A0ABU5AID7_9HYPH|nr:hypothetical protein [Mesorhizobium abyssinicae]MDX8537045.1 hypothetical protein [Mesorhizobium abyssinicae]